MRAEGKGEGNRRRAREAEIIFYPDTMKAKRRDGDGISNLPMDRTDFFTPSKVEIDSTHRHRQLLLRVRLLQALFVHSRAGPNPRRRPVCLRGSVARENHSGSAIEKPT